MASTTRYLDDRLVYDTDWYSECCPYGRALREAPSQSGKRPKNLYQISNDARWITRRVVCPICEEFLRNHPLSYPTLNKAMNALRAHQIIIKLGA